MSVPPVPPNPFAPPGPGGPPAASQPAQAPYPASPGWGGQTQPISQWNQPAPAGQPAYLGQPPPRGGRGLAITAIVLSSLALLGVLGLGGFLVVGMVSGAGMPYALNGSITVVDKGVQGPDLEAELRRIVEDDGGFVDQVECPQRSQVGQGLVTVCHGSVDGYDWTGVVVFEDDDGSFILTEY
jgi:hypothetical protein